MPVHAVKLSSRLKDVSCIGSILVLVVLVFILRNSAVPMQLWDESRVANNALEMSRAGYSLVTDFNGAPDHWSTKPPLLVWLMVACLKIGLPPLVAVRLPSIAAAISTVLMVFFFARTQLQDRLGGLLGSLTLLAGPLFVGWHTGRTGDYDSLVVLFTLAYCLAFWLYLESGDRPNAQWIVAAGAALSLAILTKGVGGVLALPALLLYAILRRRIRSLVTDARFLITIFAVICITGGYYLLREHFDHGYLTAVWQNEFTGRYLATNEDHVGGPFYYFWVLAYKFEPGFFLVPFAALPFFKGDDRRRSVSLLCLVVVAELLAVLSKSQTKVFWYLAPATPFLALAVGIGLSEGLAWLRERQLARGTLLPLRAAYFALFAVFATADLAAVYYYQVGVERKLSNLYVGGRYGPFLEEIRQSHRASSIIVLDEGWDARMAISVTGGGFAHYNPEAKFFAQIESANGMTTKIVLPGSTLPSGTWVATCDPRAYAWLAARYQVAVAFESGPWCKFAQTLGPGTAPGRSRQLLRAECESCEMRGRSLDFDLGMPNTSETSGP